MGDKSISNIPAGQQVQAQMRNKIVTLQFSLQAGGREAGQSQREGTRLAEADNKENLQYALCFSSWYLRVTMTA